MPSFPYKLHTLLETVTADEELSTIISWLPDGKSFRIHSLEKFEQCVLKVYFPRQKQVKSFMRQLQYYNFENFGEGLFCHPCFRRGQRNLCGQILHQLPTKSQKLCGTTTRPLKQRGRKKKDRSQPLDSSPEPTVAPYTVMPSSPEPSLPDDATSSSVSSSFSITADVQQSSSQEQGRGLQLDISSPTCVKKVPSLNTSLNTSSNIIKGNAQAEQLFNTVLPLLPQQVSYVTPQMLAHYEMQAITAARNNYLSVLQQELMLGSILFSKRRLSMEQSSEKDNVVPISSQSMPSPSANTHS
eukprot:CAMPEP_0113626962 /NCGR_PEP_ID=MMETSP0017_2-20120614/13953_1 /TAXON_ID=2856 /ORGANISM="Cylindrotheca closterium" /LENGTH=298 /DNA_ID=CAMNT_0000537179 /DNA_START=47 /DNA_END=943 /DNA_ORIENTATION=- /assembly_acc=CAM_ASM_000147